jgi:hypothetical protein
MKNHIFSLAVASFALSACGAADGGSSALMSDCEILAGDPEAQKNFEEIGATADGFCDCFVKLVNAKPEDQQTQMKDALERVTDDMEESGEGAEEAVSRIMGESMGMADNEDAQAVTGGISLIGEAIDDIGEGFEDNGSCPVA